MIPTPMAIRSAFLVSLNPPMGPSRLFREVCGMLANAGFVAVEGFTYTISDGRGGTSTAVVTVTVQQSVPTSVNVINGRLVIAGTSPATKR